VGVADTAWTQIVDSLSHVDRSEGFSEGEVGFLQRRLPAARKQVQPARLPVVTYLLVRVQAQLPNAPTSP
jgi:hypothetical protein